MYKESWTSDLISRFGGEELAVFLPVLSQALPHLKVDERKGISNFRKEFRRLTTRRARLY